MMVSSGGIRPTPGRTAAFPIGTGRRTGVQGPVFGDSGPSQDAPEKPPAGKPARWLDRIGDYYEKLGVGGKVLFFLTVPGASVVILYMERKRLIALFRRWRSN